jgi:hypothetical protein
VLDGQMGALVAAAAATVEQVVNLAAPLGGLVAVMFVDNPAPPEAPRRRSNFGPWTREGYDETMDVMFDWALGREP